jgi:hypothetical protein
VTCRPHPEPAIRNIRFTRRIALQCARWGMPEADQVVCDTIVNGRRTLLVEHGAQGGKVFFFEQAYPAGIPAGVPAGTFRGRVVVLAELTRLCCFALWLIKPNLRGKKAEMNLDF